MCQCHGSKYDITSGAVGTPAELRLNAKRGRHPAFIRTDTVMYPIEKNRAIRAPRSRLRADGTLMTM